MSGREAGIRVHGAVRAVDAVVEVRRRPSRVPARAHEAERVARCHALVLREAGRPEEFVFHYGRDKTKGFSKRFTHAFGTPQRLNRRSICSSNRRAPLMSFYGREFEWESQVIPISLKP